MSGIKTNLKDLGKSFDKFQKATRAEDTRRQELIAEYKRGFLNMGFNEQQATQYANQKYHAHKQGRR